MKRLLPLPIVAALVLSLTLLAAIPPLALAALPPEITALARGLKNDPALIFGHVHDNVAFEPTYGFRKGPLAALADGRANAFDQSRLLLDLLTAAGFAPVMVRGEIDPTPAQFVNWLHMDNDAALAQGLLDAAAIPATVTAGTGNAIASLSMEHVWVEVLVEGVNYVLDPAFKAHQIIPPMDLVTVTGYDRQAFIDTAMFGATNSTDSVQNIDRTAIRAELEAMGASLVSEFRTTESVMDNAVGAARIIPAPGDLPSVPPCPRTSLEQWTTVPAAYSAQVTINHQGLNLQLPMPDVYGKRLTVFYDVSGAAEVRLDGALLGTGTPGFSDPLGPGSPIPLALSIDHPYADPAMADESRTFGLRSDGAYAVFIGAAGSGRGLMESQRGDLNESLAQGLAQDSEAVLGGTLALTGVTWLAQNARADRLAAKLAGTAQIQHHLAGICGHDGQIFVDAPMNAASSVPVRLTASAATAAGAHLAALGRKSALESGVIEQTQGTPAVSTVKLLDQALANGRIVYEARADNWSTVQPLLTNYDAAALNQVHSYVNAGYRVLVPEDGALTVADWTGFGMLAVDPNQDGLLHLIAGGLKGASGAVSGPVDAQRAALANLRD